MAKSTLSRSLSEVGLAAWFGGALMGVAALPRGAADAPPRDAERIEGRVWQAWQPVMIGAIGVHLLGSLGLTLANRSRLASQRGVGSTALIKTGVTVAALGATFMAAKAGRAVAEDVREDGTAEPEHETKLRAVQWAVPVATGALLVLDALMGEQQRPTEVVSGVGERFGLHRAA